jgi:hypothetical protein
MELKEERKNQATDAIHLVGLVRAATSICPLTKTIPSEDGVQSKSWQYDMPYFQTMRMAFASNA